uniref:Sulfotransferase domain-containing protein n=1 Tax=Thermodesulfobacterium geofontis TaxID=1295609 RepID=A0A7V5XHU1_9BACT
MYLEFFKDAQPDQIKGEIKPAYLYFKEVPIRIKETFKEKADNLKFIVILKNPVDRAYSHYWMEYKRNKETLKFEYAIINELIYERRYPQHRVFSYIDRGFYSEQILNWFKFFRREQFKFIIFEEFIAEQNKIMNEILKFLCVEKEYKFENKIVFKNDYPPLNESLKIF